MNIDLTKEDISAIVIGLYTGFHESQLNEEEVFRIMSKLYKAAEENGWAYRDGFWWNVESEE